VPQRRYLRPQSFVDKRSVVNDTYGAVAVRSNVAKLAKCGAATQYARDCAGSAPIGLPALARPTRTPRTVHRGRLPENEPVTRADRRGDPAAPLIGRSGARQRAGDRQPPGSTTTTGRRCSFRDRCIRHDTIVTFAPSRADSMWSSRARARGVPEWARLELIKNEAAHEHPPSRVSARVRLSPQDPADHDVERVAPRWRLLPTTRAQRPHGRDQTRLASRA